MQEMLGNQYFMARNYLGAATVFQDVIKEDPTNINARKKLIISFTQVGKYKEALDIFINLIQENVDHIINTDPIKDDCPCPELVHTLENIITYESQSFTTFQTLGILWLYCDINRSIENFEKARQIKPKDAKINAILIILEKKINELSV